MQLTQLALADVGAGVGLGATLDDPRHRVGTRGIGERGELVQVLLRHPAAHADQHRALPYGGAPGRRERRLQHLARRAVRLGFGFESSGGHHGSTAPGSPNSRSTSFSTSFDSVPASR